MSYLSYPQTIGIASSEGLGAICNGKGTGLSKKEPSLMTGQTSVTDMPLRPAQGREE